MTSDKYPSISKTLADLHKDVLEEEKSRQRKIDTARQAVVRAAEERKAMIAAANAKKKTNQKGKKSKEEPSKADDED